MYHPNLVHNFPQNFRQEGAILVDNLEIANIDVILNIGLRNDSIDNKVQTVLEQIFKRIGGFPRAYLG